MFLPSTGEIIARPTPGARKLDSYALCGPFPCDEHAVWFAFSPPPFGVLSRLCFLFVVVLRVCGKWWRWGNEGPQCALCLSSNPRVKFCPKMSECFVFVFAFLTIPLLPLAFSCHVVVFWGAIGLGQPSANRMTGPSDTLSPHINPCFLQLFPITCQRSSERRQIELRGSDQLFGSAPVPRNTDPTSISRD